MPELTIVSSGIVSIAQLTQEARAAIVAADKIFYHAADGVAARAFQLLNPSSFDLFQMYGEGKNRRQTYIQVAELMLSELREGRNVAGIFHGHAGFFVMAARRAVAIARAEGFAARILPGVSSVDCLIAELGIDPGVAGMQIVKAGSVLRRKAQLAHWGHVVLLQVSSAGDNDYSFSGYKKSRPQALVEVLTETYGSDQELIYYQAALFPGLQSAVRLHRLDELAAMGDDLRFGPGILYFPPRGVAWAELSSKQAFGAKEAYDREAQTAIAALTDHVPDREFKTRLASVELHRVAESLAGDFNLRRRFERNEPALIPEIAALPEAERLALEDREPNRLRRATIRR
jgi:precorrin-2 methylase